MLAGLRRLGGRRTDETRPVEYKDHARGTARRKRYGFDPMVVAIALQWLGAVRATLQCVENR